MQLNDWTDLRSGEPCWRDPASDLLPASAPPTRSEIVIVGAGIMGASLAQHLTARGHGVCVLDRRATAQGATAASTALLMWAADVPLSQLIRTIGEASARQMWVRSHRALLGLAARVEDLGIACRWRSCPEVYLAGDLLDAAGLANEALCRQEAGLPSQFLAPAAVVDRFGLAPAAALLSGHAFGADPIALTLGLMRAALGAGARLTCGEDAVGLTEHCDGVTVHCRSGAKIEAEQVILATGYEPPRWYLPDVFRIQSSYAIATAPGAAPKWCENAMIWQASDPYLYARGTADGRIIVGGGDEMIADQAARDRRLGEKRGWLEVAGARVLGVESLAADRAWTAFFGTSPDGMPAIGLAANSRHVWLAAGFGGNGITFAALGAELIAAGIEGWPDPDARLFSPYRFS